MRLKLQPSPTPPLNPRYLNPSCVTFCIILKQNISQGYWFQGGVAEIGWSRDTRAEFRIINCHEKHTGGASAIGLAHMPHAALTCGTGEEPYI